MIFLRRHSWIILGFALAACAAPDPSRVNVTMMGTKSVGTAQTIVARANDTVYSLARHWGIDTRALIDTNNLQPPYSLRPGQKLYVPTPKVIQVREGDTLHSIARTYGVDRHELVRLNNLTHSSYILRRGQELKLPTATAPMPVASATADDVIDQPISSAVEQAPVIQTGPITTSQSDTGTKIHSSASGVITEEELAPPPGAAAATGTDGQSGTQTASLPPAASEPAAAPAPKTPLGSGVPKFSWPVNGSVKSAYGPKAAGRHNDGVNIGAPLGTPVRAAAEGDVVYVGDSVAGFGNLVLIRHSGGYSSAYAHMQNPLVKQGERVTAGQTIGQVGKTGNVTSPQLHFEIRKGTQAINPETMLP